MYFSKRSNIRKSIKYHKITDKLQNESRFSNIKSSSDSFTFTVICKQQQQQQQSTVS